MATTTELLEAIAPEFSGDSRIETFLEMAAAQLHATAWGSRYAYGVVYLAAHLRTLAPDDDGAGAEDAGAVTSRTTGKLTEARSGLTPRNAEEAALLRTRYGAEFLRLRRGLAGGAARVINPGA